MSNYFFAKLNITTPLYVFQDEYLDTVTENIFTFPTKAIPLIVERFPDFEYDINDVLTFPSFCIKKTLYNTLDLNAIYGANWIDIMLFDKGEHEYKMLQTCNEIKAINREKSDFDFHEKYDDDYEFIDGANELIIDFALLHRIPLNKRLIFNDPGWSDKVFFHESIVNKIMKNNPSGIEFVSADGYSEFV